MAGGALQPSAVHVHGLERSRVILARSVIHCRSSLRQAGLHQVKTIRRGYKGGAREGPSSEQPLGAFSIPSSRTCCALSTVSSVLLYLEKADAECQKPARVAPACASNNFRSLEFRASFDFSLSGKSRHFQQACFPFTHLFSGVDEL